jgi:hypothetical protein
MKDHESYGELNEEIITPDFEREESYDTEDEK